MILLKPIPSWLRSLWILVPVGVLAIYLIGKWQGSVDQRNAEIIANANLILKEGKAYRAHIQLLMNSEHNQIVSAGHNLSESVSALRLADSLSKLSATLDSMLKHALSMQDTNRILIAQNGALKGENSNLRNSLDNQMQAAAHLTLALQDADSRAQIAQTRADTLEYTLKKVMGVTECKILFIKCPSRTVSFFVGAASGLIIYEAAKKG